MIKPPPLSSQTEKFNETLNNRLFLVDPYIRKDSPYVAYHNIQTAEETNVC